jgi:hypothetical protein
MNQQKQRNGAIENDEGIVWTSPDDMLSRRAAARYLGLRNPNTLSTWASKGFGPVFSKYGTGRTAAVRYRRNDLDAWRIECQSRGREQEEEAPREPLPRIDLVVVRAPYDGSEYQLTTAVDLCSLMERLGSYVGATWDTSRAAMLALVPGYGVGNAAHMIETQVEIWVRATFIVRAEEGTIFGILGADDSVDLSVFDKLEEIGEDDLLRRLGDMFERRAFFSERTLPGWICHSLTP